MSLLDKAKQQIKKHKPDEYTDEELELAMAWLVDDVSLSQVSKVMNVDSSSTYVFLARAARQIMLSSNGRERKRK